MNKKTFPQTGFAVIAFLLCFFANAQTLIPDSNGIIYVKPDASGNGNSWNEATSDLQGAINATGVTKVFVAIGNYNVPSPHSFVMKNGVEIYGGFDSVNGIADLSHDRILPNHGASEGSVLNGKNERPVIWNYQNGVTATAVLDGFTVKNGYNTANSAGIMNNETSPTLRNLLITQNSTLVSGAGILNNNASPIVTNVIIKTNTAGNVAGGVANIGTSSPVFTNVLIAENTATSSSGVYHNGTGTATFNNATIANNTPDTFTVGSGNVALNNSIVYGGITGTYTAQYSLIEGNTDFSNGNINPTGISATAIFNDNANGNYTLKHGAVAANAGNNTLNATTSDLGGNPRIIGTNIDLGAYEQFAITPDANNILYVNVDVTGGNQSGNSWANAIPQLADALKYARLQYDADNTVYDTTPLKIYVAKGTYKPMYSARNSFYTATDAVNERDNAFVMVKNVQVYGGFDPLNGIDDLTDTRIFGTGGSILSGDIGEEPATHDNAYHLVISSNDVGNALLDGFYIAYAFSQNTSGFITVNVYPVERTMGAISCVRSSPTIANCTFQYNRTIYGGAIANYQQSSPTITNCSFIQNGASSYGGAIYNSVNSSPTIANCSFIYNGSGAIHNSTNSSPVITNCSFLDNVSKSDGGAIYNLNSSPVITNALFANNNASGNNPIPNGNGGAIYNSGSSSPVLTNITIAGNLGANAFYSTGTGSTALNNSIVFGTVSATYTAQYSLIEGNTDFTNGNINPTGITAGAVFTDNANGDYTLKNHSSVINTGNNSLNATAIDLAGNQRIKETNIDLGAYESPYAPITPNVNNILYVNINVIGGNGSGNSWENAIPQLADVLKYARQQYNANNAVYDATPLKIYVAKGTYRPLYSARDNFYTATDAIDTRDNAFVMVKNMQIYGGFDPANSIDDLTDTRIFGTGGSILTGDIGTVGYPLDNAYHVVIASDVGNAVLDGFTVRDANYHWELIGGSIYVNGYTVNRNNGGGIVCFGSSPSIANCTFSENNVWGSGGAIYNVYYSSPTITNCSFTLNGGHYGGGAIYNTQGSSSTITNCSFTYNSSGAYGGAIFNTNSSPVITNCSFTENGSGGGGAISNDNSSPTITNALFVKTIANGGSNGVIYNSGNSSPVLTNVSIANSSNGANAVYSTGTGSTTINNSILFGAVTGTYTPQYSLIEGNTDFTNGNIDMTGITSADVFYNPANGDYTLKDTSLAVNAGNNSLNTTETDLAGSVRLFGTAIDLGAYELPFTPSDCPDFTTWNGTSWSNSEPDSNKKAVIDGSLVLSADLTACELEITTNGHLEIPSGFTFTVNGQIINNASANDFVVESNAILVQIDDVENTGAVTVKRESSPMKRLDYTLWGSPVSGMLLKNFSDVSPTGGAGTLWNRVYTLGETAWNQVWATQTDFQNDTTQTFIEAQGYLYRSRNDYDAINTVIFEGEFIGVPNNGIIEIPTPFTFNAVGNPYPSPIDTDDLLADGASALYFWTNTNAPDQSGTYQLNNWATYSGAGGAIASNGTQQPDGIIKTAQGFVIGFETADENRQVIFDNSMRLAEHNGQFFKQMSNEKHRFWLNLSDEVVTYNQILVGYIENATQDIDNGIDAKMFSYEGNAIYSIIENSKEKFVIQGRGLPFTDADMVQLGFRAVNAGSFTISLNNFDGLFEEGTTQIYLKDNFSQTQHNLNEGAYTFGSEEGIFDTRFEVVYQTTMSIQNPDFQHNWIVFKQDKGFQIQTQGFELKQVSVYDMLGRRIYSSQAEGTAHQIPALTADGVYILKIITTEDKVLNKKVR